MFSYKIETWHCPLLEYMFRVLSIGVYIQFCTHKSLCCKKGKRIPGYQSLKLMSFTDMKQILDHKNSNTWNETVLLKLTAASKVIHVQIKEKRLQ